MKIHTATCEDCGYTTTSKTEQLAAKGLRMHSCDKARRKAAAKARGEARRAAVDRAPKPCHHKQTEHVHGTHACYVLDRCRCTDCSAANTSYERARAKAHAYGRFTHWVDAQPVREHVTQLQAQGMGLKTIVAATNGAFSQGAMTRLMYGRLASESHRQEGPTRRIRRDHADALLAVRATLTTLAPGARASGVGTRRRLQALMAIGWSQTKLAAEIGMEVRNFNHLVHGKRDTTAGTAIAVREVYDRLWNATPRTDARSHKAAHTRAARYAAAQGWAPPLAWDDETIDDPAAAPAHNLAAPSDGLDPVVIDRITQGRWIGRRPTRDERLEAVRILHARGASDREAAQLLGTSERQVIRDRNDLDLPTTRPQFHPTERKTA